MTNAPPTPANVAVVSVLSVLWALGVASAVDVGMGTVDVDGLGIGAVDMEC